MNPSDSTLASACAQVAYKSNAPMYVRMDKGKFPALYSEEDNFSDGLKVIKEISDINMISTGFMTQQAVKVADELKKHSIDAGVIDLYRIKPINEALLLKLISQSKQLITIEENSIVGGIGTVISELLTDNQKNIPLKRIALEDKQYFDYGSREWLHKLYKIDTDGVVEQLLAWCR